MVENNLGKKLIFDIDMLFKKDSNKTLNNSDFLDVWTDIVLLPLMWIKRFVTISEHTKNGYERNQAIIYGLLISLYKTLATERSIVCSGLINHQLASLFSRIILEDSINMQYYIRHPEKIDDFCKSCVKGELEFADLIDRKRANRKEEWSEVELLWETGLMDSIMRGLQIAGVQRGESLPRTPDMRTKTKEVGLEEFYITYCLTSHSIHGDWYNIASYNMEQKDGRFFPKFHIKGTDIRELNAILRVVYKSIREFISMYQGHGINTAITNELLKDEQLIQNYDNMYFNFRHQKPLITGMEDQVETISF